MDYQCLVLSETETESASATAWGEEKEGRVALKESISKRAERMCGTRNVLDQIQILFRSPTPSLLRTSLSITITR